MTYEDIAYALDAIDTTAVAEKTTAETALVIEATVAGEVRRLSVTRVTCQVDSSSGELTVILLAGE